MGAGGGGGFERGGLLNLVNDGISSSQQCKVYS